MHSFEKVVSPASAPDAEEAIPFIYTRIHPGAKAPKRQSKEAAGFDLALCETTYIPYAGNQLDLQLSHEPPLPPMGICDANRLTLARTGVKIALPPAHVGKITIRSSLGGRGYVLLNAPGIVDADYRGELKLELARISPYAEPYLSAGERVAQLIVEKLPCTYAYEVSPDSMAFASGATERGEKGFGSTGTHSA